MKKQFGLAAVALTAAMALTFTACGGDSSSSSDEPTKVAKVDDLSSSCEDGEEALVGEKEVPYVCKDGKWATEEAAKSSASTKKSSSSTKVEDEGDEEETCDEDSDECESTDVAESSSSKKKGNSASSGDDGSGSTTSKSSASGSGEGGSDDSGSSSGSTTPKLDPKFSGTKDIDVENCGDIWCGPAKDDASMWSFRTDAAFATSETAENPKFVWETDNVTEANFADYIKADYGVGFSAVIGTAYLNPFVELDYSLNASGEDITSWGGICLVYEADAAFSMGLMAAGLADEDNYYEASMKSTSGNVYLKDIAWTDNAFKLGLSVATGTFENYIKSVAKIRFKYRANGSFKLISFGKKGTCSLPNPPSSASSSTSGSGTLDPNFKGTKDMDESLCGNIWCGPKQEAGVWSVYTDNSPIYGGDSKFTFETEGVTDENLSDYVSADYGVGGSFSLGTKITNELGYLFYITVDASENPINITKWNGICMSYKSSIPFRMELSSDVDDNYYDRYGVTIPASETVAHVNYIWENFVQEGWGTKVSQETILKSVQSISLKFDKDSGSGSFKIISLGKEGSCGKTE